MGWKPTGGGSGTTSPLTTKGDLWGYDTDDDRIPVGSDGQYLVADSSTPLGVGWETPGVGSGLWDARPQLPSSPFIPWDGDLGSLSAVDITGTQTVTEGVGVLSVLFEDQASGDVNVRLKAHSFSVGDAFMVPVKIAPRTTIEDFLMAGLVFTDGTTSAANAVWNNQYLQSSGSIYFWQGFWGTLTNVGASSSSFINPRLELIGNTVYQKITYTASNTFTCAWSPDGVTDFYSVTATPTMTPTHVGVGWSAWNASSTNAIRLASFGPVVQVA